MSDLPARLQAALGDAYRIERELGGGGMSRVFLAEERRLGRHVVVKVLPPELAAGVSTDRFRREIQLAAALQHPLIVPLLTADASGDLLYYVMPFVEGDSLRARLAQEGELPVPDLVRILRDVADALAYAHRHGVVHRDIKPENVLLAEQHALVTDFGVAKAVSQAAGSSTLTTAGVALGTPAYMAPEQAAADPHADHRSDIYALGALGYEMLTGRPPFTGATAQQVIAAHVTEAPQPITKRRPGVPAALAAVVMRCLEKFPADRWQTADDLLTQLEALMTPSGGTTPAVARRIVSVRWRRRGFALAMIGLLGFAGAWLWWRGRTPSGPSISETRVAVLPFSVHGGEEIAYLGDGMVNLLGTSLDGAGDLHTVDPRALLGLVAREGNPVLDPQSGAALAQRLGAGLYVLGDVVKAGEGLRLEASLYDGRRGAEPVARGAVGGSAAQVFSLVDELATQLLANRSGGPGTRVTRLAAVTTSSLPALKAYLEGERRFRAGQFTQALDAFQHAAALDSLFALAYYRTSITAEWLVRSDVSRQAAEQAVRHSDRLSDHDRSLLEALLASRRGDAATAERLYRSIVTLYPDDVEAWFQLGEVLFHYGPPQGRSIGLSREAWTRVLNLEPTNAAALLHLARVAAEERHRVELDSLVRRVLELSPQGERVLEMEALRAVALGDSAARARVVMQLRQAGDLALPQAVWSAVVYAGDYAGAEEVVRVLTEPGRSARVRALGYVARAHLELARGRGRAASRELALLDSVDHPASLEYRALFATLPFVPVSVPELESLRRQLTAWSASAVPPVELPNVFLAANNGLHRHIRAYLLGLLSARLRDTTAAERWAAELEGLGDPPPVHGLGRDMAQGVRAAAAARQGQPGRALEALARARFEAWYELATGTAFVSLPSERFRRAELLNTLARPRDAIQWYGSFADFSLYAIIYVAPALLRSARLFEQLQQPAQAAERYARFVALWQDCDPELRPELEEARTRLARLRGGAAR